MGSQILLLMTSISTIIDVLKVSKVSIFRTETPFYFIMPLDLEIVKMCKQTQMEFLLIQIFPYQGRFKNHAKHLR